MTCAVLVTVTTGYVTHHVPCGQLAGHCDDCRPPVGLPDHDCATNACPAPAPTPPPPLMPAPNSMSLRLAAMTEEAAAEMAEWDLILRGKPLRR